MGPKSRKSKTKGFGFGVEVRVIRLDAEEIVITQQQLAPQLVPAHGCSKTLDFQNASHIPRAGPVSLLPPDYLAAPLCLLDDTAGHVKPCKVSQMIEFLPNVFLAWRPICGLTSSVRL